MKVESEFTDSCEIPGNLAIGVFRADWPAGIVKVLPIFRVQLQTDEHKSFFLFRIYLPCFHFGIVSGFHRRKPIQSIFRRR